MGQEYCSKPELPSSHGAEPRSDGDLEPVQRLAGAPDLDVF